MASNMEKDSFTYQQERSDFVKELQQYHQNNGTPIPRMPTIAGREVDLYLLYSQVQEMGGWNKVADAELWDELLGEFGLPYACTNAGLALRQIYLRYLYQYDREHNTDESVVQEEETQAGASKRAKLGPMAGVAVRYNYRQHNVSVLVRAANGLSTDLLQPHEYNKLHRALLSGLPNEVDFAVNVCTLLSNEGRRKLRLNACPGLLDLFMAHVGIFRDGSSSLFDMAREGWDKGPKRNFIQFWLDSVSHKEVRKLVSPTSLYEDSKKDKPPEPSKDVEVVEEGDNDEEEEVPLDEVLALGRDLGMHDVEGQRILQLAMIVRNLSFEEENIKVLAKNILVFRFLMLCIHCKYSTLRQLALDAMGNIAVQMLMEPLGCKSTKLLLQTLSRCISSPDRFEVVRGLEILSGLCQVDGNSSVLECGFSEKMYRDMVSYLSVQDIQLVVYTLEAMYQLSELGNEVCEAIARIRVVVDLLVSLLTVEAQSYGPNSLTGIKVVEHVPAGATSTVTGSATTTKSTPSAPQRSRSMAPPLQTLTASQPQLQPMPPPQQRPQPIQQIQQVQRPVRISTPDKPVVLQPSPTTYTMARAPAPVVASTMTVSQPQPVKLAPAPSPAPAPTLAPAPAPAASSVPVATQPGITPPPFEMDSEATTCKWLQAHYEYGNLVMTKSDMYHHYLASCSRLNTVVNSACFSKCVRVAFPKVDSKRVGVDQRSFEMHYRGLQRRAKPLPFPHDGGTKQPARAIIQPATPRPPMPSPPPSSPLPAATPPSTPPAKPATTSPSAYPTIQHALLAKVQQRQQQQQQQQQQAIEGITPDSQVIKSLLAKKVSQNMALAVHNGLPVTTLSLPGVPAQYVSPPGQQAPTVQVISVHPSQFATKRPAAPLAPAAALAPAPAPAPAPEVDILAQAAEAAGLDESDGGPEDPTWQAEDTTTLQPPPAPVVAETDPNYNLEVCSQAELAGTVVSDEQHQARIERVVNACVDSPSPAAPGSEEATITRVNNSGLDVLQQHITSSTTRPPPLHPTETLTPEAAGETHPDPDTSKENQPAAANVATQDSPMDTSESADLKPVIDSQSHQEPALSKSPINGTEPSEPADPSISSQPRQNGDVCLNGPVDSPLLTKPLMNGEVHAEDLADSKLTLSAAELKKAKLAQLMDQKYSKDSLALNGLVKHVGNGDCVVNFAKEGELRGPDNVVGEGDRTCKAEPVGLEKIVENGFISDSDKDMESSDSHSVNEEKCASPVSSQAATNCVSVSTVSSNVHSAPVWQHPGGTLPTGVPSATPTSSLPGAPVRLAAPVTAASAAPVVMTTSQTGTQVLVVGASSDSSAAQAAGGSLTIADILRSRLAASESAEDRPSTPEMPTAAQLQAQLAQATGLQASLPPPAAGTVAARLSAPTLPATSSIQVANVIRVSPAALLPSSSAGQIAVLRASGPVPIQPRPTVATPGQIPIAPKPSVTSGVILPAGLQVASAQPGILVQQQPATLTVQTQPLMAASSGLKRPAETSPGGDERAAKLVRVMNTNAQPQQVHVDRGDLMCEWSGCRKRFETAKEVKRHVTKSHWDKSASFGVCCWAGCDSLRRQKYSLLSHLTDRHCTEQALRASHAKRLALAKQGQPEPPANIAPKVVGPAPVYPNDAALQAIRRFAIRPPYPEFGEVKEGPVTKHIRLTSALILRNLAKFSAIARRLLWKHEEHLAYVALSSVEASTAIATCLGEISRTRRLSNH